MTMRATRLPKRIVLAGGDVVFVPARTVMLNPEQASDSDYLYLVWAWSGEEKEVGLDEAEDLFGWFTSIDRLEILAYTGSDEFDRMLDAVLGLIGKAPSKEIALMRAASLDVTEGMVARFKVG